MLKSIMKALVNTVEGPAIETETTKELILDTPVKRAKINVHNGKITLRQWDRQEVKAYVQVRATGEYAERAGDEKNTDQFWTLEATGTSIVFEQLPQKKFMTEGSLTINVEIFIPQNIEAQAHTHNGMIDVADFTGELEAHTHNGDLLLEKITGNTELQTHNGNIDINHLDGNLRMETHNGHLRVTDLTGRIKGRTHNGKIILNNAGQKDVNVETHNGAIRIKTHQEIDGEWNLTTHAGDIEISLPPATSAALSLKTASGRISGKALNSDGARDAKKVIAQLGEGKNQMYIETHRGNIEVQYLD